jgi:hypothetical protein
MATDGAALFGSSQISKKSPVARFAAVRFVSVLQYLFQRYNVRTLICEYKIKSYTRRTDLIRSRTRALSRSRSRLSCVCASGSGIVEPLPPPQRRLEVGKIVGLRSLIHLHQERCSICTLYL